MRSLTSTRLDRCRTTKPHWGYFGSIGIPGLRRTTSLRWPQQDSRTSGLSTLSRLHSRERSYDHASDASPQIDRWVQPSYRVLVCPKQCFHFTLYPRRVAIHPARVGLGEESWPAHRPRPSRCTGLAKRVSKRECDSRDYPGDCLAIGTHGGRD